MLKLKVGASFQVLTIEQKAQPTLMYLLRLVKIKIHSGLSSCHSRCNYYIEDWCLNWSCCSTRLFKDMLGNLIHVSQDLCPNREEVSLPAASQVVFPPGIQDKHLELGKFIQNRGGLTSSPQGLTPSVLVYPER